MNECLKLGGDEDRANDRLWVVEATAHARDVILESTNSAQLTVCSRPVRDIRDRGGVPDSLDEHEFWEATSVPA